MDKKSGLNSDDKALLKRHRQARSDFDRFMDHGFEGRTDNHAIQTMIDSANGVMSELCEPMLRSKPMDSIWGARPKSSQPSSEPWRQALMCIALLARSSNGSGAPEMENALGRLWGGELAKELATQARPGQTMAHALESPPRDCIAFALACAALCSQRSLDIVHILVGARGETELVSRLVDFCVAGAMRLGAAPMSKEASASSQGPEGALIRACGLARAANALDSKQKDSSGLCNSWIFNAHSQSSLGSSILDIWRAGSMKLPLASAIVRSFGPFILGMSDLLERAAREGALQAKHWSGPWSGPHPLRLLAQPRPTVAAPCIAAMETLRSQGYLADWSIPKGFEGSAQNPASDSEPNFLLQWTRSNSHCLAKAVEISISSGVDFQARNKRGESALGALNRRARNYPSQDAQDALALALAHGDPEDLGAKKDSDSLAATPGIRAVVLAARERQAMTEGIDAELWLSCLAQARDEAQAMKTSTAAPKRRL